MCACDRGGQCVKRCYYGSALQQCSMCACNNGGAGLRVLVTSGEGIRVHKPWLMEEKQPPAPTPAVQKSAFSMKTQTTSQILHNMIRQHERQFNPLI